MEISSSECAQIVKRVFKRGDAEVISFGYDSASDAARGFIAESNILWINVAVNGETKNLRFFVKLPPSSQYHFKLVQTTRAFYKESQFFNVVYPLLKKYFKRKIFPKCFFSNPSVTVLEDLKALGYSNNRAGILDVDHCKATLKSLASFHAASLMYEHEVKSTFDQTHSDILFVSWFSHLPDHPGNVHLQTGIRALNVVLDRYFSHETEEIRQRAVDILKAVPSLLLPSKNHRNALSHSDLWSNNIMFKYNDEGGVENACLIDLQIFAYNPPAHDVYTLLFLNATNSNFTSQMVELSNFYYQSFCEAISDYGLDPNQFLSYSDFQKSKSESIPLGLGSAVLFTHFTTLPEEYLSVIIKNEDLLKNMMEKDRVELVCKSIDNFSAYRKLLFSMMNNLLEYIKGDLTV